MSGPVPTAVALSDQGALAAGRLWTRCVGNWVRACGAGEAPTGPPARRRWGVKRRGHAPKRCDQPAFATQCTAAGGCTT